MHTRWLKVGDLMINPESLVLVNLSGWEEQEWGQAEVGGGVPLETRHVDGVEIVFKHDTRYLDDHMLGQAQEKELDRDGRYIPRPATLRFMAGTPEAEAVWRYFSED